MGSPLNTLGCSPAHDLAAAVFHQFYADLTCDVWVGQSPLAFCTTWSLLRVFEFKSISFLFF